MSRKASFASRIVRLAALATTIPISPDSVNLENILFAFRSSATATSAVARAVRSAA
jgi:hypothetical protein